MKLLSWMQRKLQGEVKFQNKESDYSFASTAKERVPGSPPVGLLAIGTFGGSSSSNNNNDEDQIDDDEFDNSEAVVEEIEEWKGSNYTHKCVVKKCVPFLVKKLFVCGSGSSAFSFANLRDTPPPQGARMKKILRMMLHKKIYPNMPSLKRFIKEKAEIRNNEDN